MLPSTLLVLLLLPAVTDGPTPRADGQERERVWEEKHAEDAERTAEAAERAVADEVARLGADHAWAGSYYAGDGLGVNVSLDLAPTAGFVFGWHGCLGLYDRNYGPVAQQADGTLRLLPRLPNEDRVFAGIDEELIPVTWGPRRYLVPGGRARTFCNAVNSGAEPRESGHGIFLLRRGDEKMLALGRPNGPVSITGCLLTEPIRTRVLTAERAQRRKGRYLTTDSTTITLGAGRAEGVYEGLEFQAAQGNWLIEVTEVGEHTSQAVAEDVLSDPEQKPRRLPVGTSVSTRP